jgi:hypothetical protein
MNNIVFYYVSKTPSSDSKPSQKAPYRKSNFIYNNFRLSVLINSIAFLLLNNRLYLSLSYANMGLQYCPLQYCSPINATYIHTPLLWNVSINVLSNSTTNIRNTTKLNWNLKTKYGCEIEFENCLEANASSKKTDKLNGLWSLIIICYCCLVLAALN